MRKHIELHGKRIAYDLKPNKRSKSLRLTIRRNEVLVTFPSRMPAYMAEQFLRQKADWILERLQHFEQVAQAISPFDKLPPYAKAKKQALEFVTRRVELLNNFYGFAYTGISVRNQKTRWGSCSSNGKLSFNYRIIGLPPLVADYIIVHELCHLKEMNHSPKFWSLIAQTLPEYRKLRRELKGEAIALL